MRAWRMLSVVALFVALLAPVSAARADQLEPNAIDKAKEMLTVTNELEAMDTMLGLVSQSMESLIERANPGHEKEVRDFMTKYYMPEVRRRLPEFGDLMAEEWARYFTAEELDQLIAFYRSDIGQKLIALQPKLMQDGLHLGQAWGEKVAREVYQKMMPWLKKQGLKSPNI
jgi:hypothetical protein